MLSEMRRTHQVGREGRVGRGKKTGFWLLLDFDRSRVNLFGFSFVLALCSPMRSGDGKIVEIERGVGA